MRENTDKKKSEYSTFYAVTKQKPKAMTQSKFAGVKKFCVHGMIFKNYLRYPLINVSVFTKYIVKMKLQKYSLLSVADANLENKPYSCNIKECDFSLTLMGALVVVGMFVTPI